jgi:RNA polymerase sigma-70 factor (ECF subfamily)
MYALHKTTGPSSHQASVALVPKEHFQVGPRAGVKQNEEELVLLAQSGNQHAFELLVLKFQQRIVYGVGRLVGESDAPDVAQETFIKAYRALRHFRGQSSFYTWLFRIGINSAKNHLAARSRRPSTQDIDSAEAESFGHTEEMSDVGTPEAMALSEEIKEHVFRAIHRLQPELRRAIVLREIDGLSYEEIAESMRCPVGTVRSRIFRAREAIDLVVEPLMAA